MTVEDQDMITGMQGVQMALVCLMDRQQALYLGYELQDCCVKASSCIFLTLSLRLFPSLCGFFVILLHVVTIIAAVSGCSATLSGSNKWYAAHMASTSLTAIFQGSVSVLIFTQTGDFLGYLKSYVREEDGAVILKLAGGLCLLIFCLEWVVLVLAFLLRYYAFVEGNGNSAGDGSFDRIGKV
ncbi:hypothetical protein H0E87_022750 [Populus deltoides]|uniref:Uncharacterized protein n=1 Tax=Populus deltoides TaxID=3696 RepID=A0A8T2XD62_POPDE|nr:hypothetical protein H0E87_022750 [Populus deltoides]